MRSHKDYKWYYITTQFNWEGSAVYILVSLNSQKKSRKKVIYFLKLLLIINYLMLQWHLVIIIYVSLRSTFQFFLFFLVVTIWSCSGSKGWCSGESTCLPPMWPGFKSRHRTPYVGWVCCWFSPLLRQVFLRVLRFSPLLKNQHFQIPAIQPGIRKTKNHFVDVLPPNHYLLFIYLFIYLCVQTLHAYYEIFLFQLLLWTFRYHYLHKIPSSTKERE